MKNIQRKYSDLRKYVKEIRDGEIKYRIQNNNSQ